MFTIEGRGVFFGEEDVALGMKFAETVRNEGFHVTVQSKNLYEPNEKIEKRAYIVEFTTEGNTIFIP